MISTRAAISVGAALVGLAIIAGPRVLEPSIGIAAERLVRQRAQIATDALDALHAAIQPGLDDARRAAAAVLTADEPPGRSLMAAGEGIAGADAAVSAARGAITSLNGARTAWRSDIEPLPEPIAAGELPSIGAQLGAAAPAADAFADLRARGTGLPGMLEDAVAALEDSDLDAAAELVAQARADHALVSAWRAAPPTLPVWIETSDAMISAMEEIVSATRAGDAAAANAAAETFASLANDAATADRALRIALGEGGSALTAAPLERLAGVLGGIEGARAATVAITAAGPDR